VLSFLRWLGIGFLACLVLTAILGLLLVIRMLAYAVAALLALALIALLLNLVFKSRSERKRHRDN
jgi:uncharacterized membrane protein YfcA